MKNRMHLSACFFLFVALSTVVAADPFCTGPQTTYLPPSAIAAGSQIVLNVTCVSGALTAPVTCLPIVTSYGKNVLPEFFNVPSTYAIADGVGTCTWTTPDYPASVPAAALYFIAKACCK